MEQPIAQPLQLAPPLSPPVRVMMVTPPEDRCPYLPGLRSRMRAFHIEQMPPELYHEFMDAGFRRSGKIIYQPVCRTCRACVPIRVPVERFHPDKSQRRCWRRNQDLSVTIGPPQASDEKYALYQRYQVEWHQSTTDGGREGFETFLYESPVESLEFTYRDGAGRLLAVGICDLCPQSLSSVYFYHDPSESRRGLGTFGAIWEISYARQHRIPFYYLGYTVAGCAAMQYKASYRPCELLGPDGRWRERG